VQACTQRGEGVQCRGVWCHQRCCSAELGYNQLCGVTGQLFYYMGTKCTRVLPACLPDCVGVVGFTNGDKVLGQIPLHSHAG
jgi:hypothetical protein